MHKPSLLKQTAVQNFGDLAFTPSVRAVQEQHGSRVAQARLEGVEHRAQLGAEELEFIAARDSFYLATVGENGWPYVQHRGGPPGFLRHLGGNDLGFADLRGNRQYISTGNVDATGKACLFLMDYPNRYRLKLWVEAIVTEAPNDLVHLRSPGAMPATLIERGFLLRVLAFDWNCSQYITPRYSVEEWTRRQGP